MVGFLILGIPSLLEPVDTFLREATEEVQRSLEKYT
jgi:hypothetical protein